MDRKRRVRGEGFEPPTCRFLPEPCSRLGQKPDYSRPLYQIELPPDPEGIMLRKF